MRTVHSPEHLALSRKLRNAKRRLDRALAGDRHSQATSIRAEMIALEATVGQHKAEFQERLAAAREVWEAKRGNLATIPGIDPAKRNRYRLRQKRKQEALGKESAEPKPWESSESEGSQGRPKVNWAGNPESECFGPDDSCPDPNCDAYNHTGSVACAVSGKWAHPSRRGRGR